MNGGNNGVDRDREESRSSEIAGSHSVDWSIAKAGRLEETAPLRRPRPCTYSDRQWKWISSQSSRFSWPRWRGGLAQSHSLSRCTKGRGGLTATMPCLYTNRSLPVMQISASPGGLRCKLPKAHNLAIEELVNLVNTNLLCCALLEAHVFTAPALAVD